MAALGCGLDQDPINLPALEALHHAKEPFHRVVIHVTINKSINKSINKVFSCGAEVEISLHVRMAEVTGRYHRNGFWFAREAKYSAEYVQIKPSYSQKK